MAKWRTLGISVQVDNKIKRGREFCDLTKKYFELLKMGKTDEIKNDPKFSDWEKVIF